MDAHSECEEAVMPESPTTDERRLELENALDAHQRARRDSVDVQRLREANERLDSAVEGAVEHPVVEDYERESFGD
jgi:hypothetical protein